MVDALLGVVFENLTSLLQNEFSTISGIKSKAQKLSNNLVHIKAVLEDAEKKQFKEVSIKLWLQDLKDAVYVLDDILDEYSIESCRLRGFTSFKPNNILFRHEIGSRLKEITRRLDGIAESKNKFSLQTGGTLREITDQVAEGRQTGSNIAEPKVFGREDDKEKIVEFLLTQARDSDFLSVYPIVGLGGIGKTTLVQLVYNDDRVSGNFEKKNWVCVSETFSVKRILCSIIESITLEKCPDFEYAVMERKVQGLLQGKRYLLVLDDVWNQNQQLESGLTREKWNKLKPVLSCGSKGSSILVSTRDEVVATITGTYQTHHRLSSLSDSQCWLLFEQYAFGHYKEECADLVAIGKEIVKKCNGLPLAAKALGSLMNSRKNEKEWLKIKDSELWDLSDENSILPALRLSYFYLTPTLKQCFSFCAIFPKDEVILKEELIQLWMANGLISSRGNTEVEDVGIMVWDELYQKSFFQDRKMNGFSGDISFKMHDLVHDLAQSVTGKECMYLENANMTSLTKNTHHISFNSENLLSFDEGAFRKVESLRTLFELNGFPKKHDHFPLNGSLRVLSTSSLQVPVWSLIHLRYLKLCSLGIKKLPDSIYNLKKLEILKINHSTNLSCLPKRLACLQNLRHIVIDRCWSLSRMFPNIGKLTCLKTLKLFCMNNLKYLDDDESQDGMEVRVFPSLEELELCGLRNIEGLLKVEKGEMFPCLSRLYIIECPKLGLPCLPSLKSLTVNGCNNELLRSISTFRGLTQLTLSQSEGITSFPEGMFKNLTSLQYLWIYNCNELESLPEQNWEGLQSLRTLEIVCCERLRCLPEGIRHLTSLERLKIWSCPTLEERCKEGTGEDWDKIAHIPKISFKFEWEN